MGVHMRGSIDKNTVKPNIRRHRNERRLIYNLLRYCGLPPMWANRMRDWSANKILIFMDTIL